VPFICACLIGIVAISWLRCLQAGRNALRLHVPRAGSTCLAAVLSEAPAGSGRLPCRGVASGCREDPVQVRDGHAPGTAVSITIGSWLTGTIVSRVVQQARWTARSSECSIRMAPIRRDIAPLRLRRPRSESGACRAPCTMRRAAPSRDLFPSANFALFPLYHPC